MTRVAEVLWKPEKIKIPNRIGEDAANQQKPRVASSQQKQPSLSLGARCLAHIWMGYVRANQRPFGRRNSWVFFWPLIEPEPGNHPKEAEAAGQDEDSPPTPSCGQNSDDRRCDGRAERRSSCVYPHYQRAFLRRKPLRDSLRGGGIITRLADPQQESKRSQRKR